MCVVFVGFSGVKVFGVLFCIGGVFVVVRFLLWCCWVVGFFGVYVFFVFCSCFCGWDFMWSCGGCIS